LFSTALAFIVSFIGLLTASAEAPQRILSPEVHPDRRVTFRLKAPNAREVLLKCEAMKPAPMKKDERGVWSITTEPFEPDIYAYSFVVDNLSVIDPANPYLKYNLLFTQSQVHVRGPAELPWEINDVPHGVIHRHHYKSTIIGDDRDLLVYTPPRYDPAENETYPVLYLLHGYSDAEDAWISAGRANVILDNLIARNEAKPMIVVMPYGYGNKELIALGWERIVASETEAIWQDSLAKFSDSLMREIIPMIEKSYRVSNSGTGRAIAGLSMGGTQSLLIGLNAPEKFAWIGSFSAGRLLDDYESQFRKLEKNDAGQIDLLWIGCGTEDWLFPKNQSLVEWLRKKGVNHRWVEKPGGHSFTIWRRFLAEFASLLFKNAD
jgi:enterochelin esterase-like enzyme